LGLYVNRMDSSSAMAYFNIVGYMMHGSVELYLGDFNSAASDYQSAYLVNSNLAQSYSTWFGGWHVTPDRERALADLRIQLSADPTNADLCLQVANMNMELGRWSEALMQYNTYLGMTNAPVHGVADFVALIEALYQ
jgi:hypothetical protein